MKQQVAKRPYDNGNPVAALTPVELTAADTNDDGDRTSLAGADPAEVLRALLSTPKKD